ncbi:MAG: hypothetical protein HC840_00490 [Leptolyngbyaceae cyanobacterium RM2_2_4]|nr:hypothetical protein [Leptolyngbyaceae cyanobacterium RM2_2_4]
MRIAFDVKGTVEGSKGAVILEAFRKLQGAGHTCVVWSNLYSYATDAIAKHGLDAEAESKRSTRDLEDYSLEPFDVAIEDDRSQTWLGAKRLIFVDEITDADSLIEAITKG